MRANSEQWQTWSERIEEWSRSKIPRSRWCREQNLSYYAFQYWYKKIVKEGSDMNASFEGEPQTDDNDFVELGFQPAGATRDSSKPIPKSSGCTLPTEGEQLAVSICYKDFVVGVTPSASKETLSMVMEVLAYA